MFKSLNFYLTYNDISQSNGGAYLLILSHAK